MNEMQSNPKKVLVVDDNEAIVRLWNRVLTKEGFDVTTATNGEEAIDKLKNEQFAVVFSDINMPNMDGKNLLKFIKQAYPTVCVNMITGVATVEGAVECMRLGACDYLSKPCDNNELVAMAFRCLRHYDHALEIRRLKETVTRLEEVDKLKSEFVSNVSHELRTPLFALGAALEILDGEIAPTLGDSEKKLFEVIENNYGNLLRLVNNILNFSRLETGAVQLHYQNFDLTSSVKKNLSMLSPLAQKKQITLESEITPDPFPVISADQNQLEHVFLNLLGNALKFTPSGGRVGIRLEDLGAQIQICVWDTGPGIDPQYHLRVFDRFYQVDGSATREAGGTGIGLSLVKAIADLHGGRAWVESELNKGSKFYFSIPKQQISKEKKNHEHQ